MANNRPVPVGIDNFKEVIEDGYCYVDKTDLIDDVLTRGAKVNLFPRPRRFGKTLTISMLENYFNIKKKEENKDLFKGLKIENGSGKVREAQGKYPVISLNLKGIKDVTWEEELSKLKNILSDLYKANKEVKDVLDEDELNEYITVERQIATSATYQLSLKNYLNI